MVYIICAVQQYNVWDILGKIYTLELFDETLVLHLYPTPLPITLPIPDQILKMTKVLIDLRDYNFQRHGAIILQ